MVHANDRAIKHRIGLRNLARKTGKRFESLQDDGAITSDYYRYKPVSVEGGVKAVLERNRRSPKLENHIDPAVESFVVERALEEPAHGQTRTSNELRKRGTFVLPSGVCSPWQGLEEI